MKFTIKEIKSYKNLTIMQIYVSQKKTFEYISGRTALQENLLEIKEITESGSVNEILVNNKSEHFVFMMDGDILVGAKQNRVVNTSILLAPFAKIHLPVSCIEQGRWHHSSENFHFSDNIVSNNIRMKKSVSVNENLETDNSFLADQSEVWDNIESESEKFNMYSRTNDLNEIIESQKEKINDKINTIKPDKKANGVILFRNNKIVSADIFGSKLVFKEYFNRIVINGFIEKQEMDESKSINLSSKKLISKANRLFLKVKELEYKKYKGVGVGSELRGETKKYTITQLRHKSSIIHIAVLNKD